MGSPITYALHVAETLGLRRFIGNLYYLELVSSKMRTKEIEGSTAFVHPTHDLTPSQRLTLYEGGWSLQRYWLKHVNAPIEVFNCPPDDEHSCNELWKSLWPQYIVDLADKSFDPLDFLSDLPEFVTSMNEDCFDGADISCLQFYVRNNIRRLRDSLADHFLGPLPSGSPVPSVS
ncbi:hypothetical protein BDN70DRAFT_563668 [Pholiota conissans]|uniref:Uncharacterized protein n=1 Tax=Pholiota conissans TaxID=109636 RepID=A0A9P5Z597_9AGAR|nr:hypothetical protein BDN70DRAFT_563668 [Pholiota conissans]